MRQFVGQNVAGGRETERYRRAALTAADAENNDTAKLTGSVKASPVSQEA